MQPSIPWRSASSALGLESGDRVAHLGAELCRVGVLQYATARVGVVLVNVNPAYRTHELAYVLHQSGCRLLVSAQAVQDLDYVAMVDAVRERVYRRSRGSSTSERRSGSSCGRWPAPRDRTRFARDRPLHATIRSTSSTRAGTTGFPKGATLSHHNIVNNGFFIGERCRYDEADRVCIPVPFYHCFGMVLGNLAVTTHGACIVIPAPGFDPAATLQAVQAERCTVALRRADDVHRGARAARLRKLRPAPRCGRGSWPARRARSK